MEKCFSSLLWLVDVYKRQVYQGFTPIIIATKLDKIKRSQIQKNVKAIREGLKVKPGTVDVYKRQVTDRPVANGDTAVIDFEGFVDGIAFEGGKGEDVYKRQSLYSANVSNSDTSEANSSFNSGSSFALISLILTLNTAGFPAKSAA